MGVPTRKNEIMVTGPDGNERAWPRGLPEDKRWDADAVIRVRGSHSGTEFELRITAEPELDVQAERSQVSPTPVIPFSMRIKNVAQYGYTQGCKGCRARAGNGQQAHDEACRTRIMQELMKTAEDRNRIDEMRYGIQGGCPANQQ